MYNDLFQIGPITIHGYGLMIALGIAIVIILSSLMAKKRGLKASVILDLAICILLSGFFGAKLLSCIVHWNDFIQSPLSFLKGSGFVIYGGLIVGAIACFIYSKKTKLDTIGYFDLLLPNVLIGHGIGRIGCLLAGCCHGIEYDGFGSIMFTNSQFAPNNIPLFPSQIVSSIFLFTTGIILTIIAHKQILKRGVSSALYLLIYSIGRFTIEFFRGDVERGFIGPLSTSQFISLFIFIGGIILLIFSLKNKFMEVKNDL